MKKIVILAVVAIMAATSAFAQSKMSNRTKVINTAAKNSRSEKSPSRATIKSVNDVQYIAAFVRFKGGIDVSLIEKYGGQVRAQYPKIATVTANIPVAALESLAAEEAIDYIEAAQETRVKMDQARSASNATKAMTGEAPLPHAFKGSGVIVGVVDQEMQVSHTNFWNEDKTRFRIKSFWNQNKSGNGGYGFSYGKFYTDSASIISAAYDVSSMSSGHATHVTGIAAGADHTLDYYGIAGEADIVMTSTTGEDADLTDGVQYIFQYADSVGKPCVVNISMGSELGAHDGTDLCCQVLESLVKPGNVIIGAAGNSGDANVHLQKNFTSTDTLAKTFMDFGYSWWGSYALMDAWGEVGNDFELALVAYSGTGDSIFHSTPFYRASKDTSFTLTVNKTGVKKVKFTAEIASGISALNNKPNISIQFEKEELGSGLYLGVIIRTDTGRVDMWINDYYSTFTDNGYSSRGWMSGDDDISVGTGIAETRNVVAVGAYTTRDATGSSTVGDIASFSSKGPTADGRLKPEISAPGEGIMSSVPDKVASSYWGSGSAESTTVGGKKYYYDEMSGTSMACPYVTGVVALWLEANPNLDYDDLIDIFAHTAKKDQYTGTLLPDNTWGYGKIDAYQGLLYILGLPSGVESVTEHQIVALYPNPTEGAFNIGFASTDRDVIVSVYDLSGKVVYTENVGDINAGEERSFSIADAPNGVYMVRIAGEKQSKCYKIVKQ